MRVNILLPNRCCWWASLFCECDLEEHFRTGQWICNDIVIL